MEIVALVTVFLSTVHSPLCGLVDRHLPAAQPPEQYSRDYCTPTDCHQKEQRVCGQDQVPRHNSSSPSSPSSSSPSSPTSGSSQTGQWSIVLIRPFSCAAV